MAVAALSMIGLRIACMFGLIGRWAVAHYPSLAMLGLALPSFVLLGITAMQMSLAGFNADEFSSRQEKRKFCRRARAVWNFFPVSCTITLALMILSVVFAYWMTSRRVALAESFPMSAFDLWVVFYNLRVVPAGTLLLNSWAAEDALEEELEETEARAAEDGVDKERFQGPAARE